MVEHQEGRARESELRNAEQEVDALLQRHLNLMQVTEPSKLETEILTHANANFSAEEARSVEQANQIAKDLYGGKERKHSHTKAILHAYRVTLTGDNSEAYKMIIKILHDTAEDFDLSPRAMRAEFGSMGDLVSLGVDTFTKRKGEPYDAYLARIRRVAEAVPDLGHLISDKSSGDMINNCLDPFGLPSRYERKPNTVPSMEKFLEKIDTHAGAFLDGYPVLLLGVTRAVDLGVKALNHPDLIIPKGNKLPPKQTIYRR